MKSIVVAGAALVALTASAAVAQPEQRGGQPLTRAAVEARVDAGFARADANRDGFITQDEVRAGRQDRRGNRGEARAERREQRGERRAALFARLDANRDGSISRTEFESRQAVRGGDRAERREARSERQADRRSARGERRGGQGGGLFARFGGRMFGQADANRDGRISRDEARSGALAVFARVDTDRNGTISAEERRAARESMRAQRQQRRQG